MTINTTKARCKALPDSDRVGVNSIPELKVNSNSNSGIGIEIGGIENGVGIENPGIGIEKQNWIFGNWYIWLNSENSSASPAYTTWWKQIFIEHIYFRFFFF